jgi:phosphomevalonate kinase
VKDITATVKEIVESFKDPSMVKNIENFRLTLESIERISSKIESLRTDTQNSGMMDEISSTIKACRLALDTLNNEGGTKELVSVSRNLISEISSTVLEIRQLLHTIGNADANADVAGIVANVKDIRDYTKSVREDFK